MADEGNIAVLEPVNIDPEPQATSETPVEAAVAPEVESDAPDTVESDESAPPNLSALTDEQLRELPEVKSLLARETKAIEDKAVAADRQRQQEAGARQWDATRQSAEAQAQASTLNQLATNVQALANLITRGETLDSQVLKQSLSQVMGRPFTQGFVQATGGLLDAIAAHIEAPDWYPELKAELPGFKAIAQSGRPFELLTAWTQKAGAVEYGRGWEAGRAELLKEQAAATKGEAGVKDLQDNARERANQPSPTQVSGRGVKARTARQILDDPNSSVEARKKALYESTGFQL